MKQKSMYRFQSDLLTITQWRPQNASLGPIRMGLSLVDQSPSRATIHWEGSHLSYRARDDGMLERHNQSVTNYIIAVGRIVDFFNHPRWPWGKFFFRMLVPMNKLMVWLILRHFCLYGKSDSSREPLSCVHPCKIIFGLLFNQALSGFYHIFDPAMRTSWLGGGPKAVHCWI